MSIVPRPGFISVCFTPESCSDYYGAPFFSAETVTAALKDAAGGAPFTVAQRGVVGPVHFMPWR